jgi:hypothetical protein
MKFLLLFATILLFSWVPASPGYSDLDLLYADFVKVLKSDDEQALKDYCFAITPDSTTVAWMKLNRFSYRGIPGELERKGFKPGDIGEHYYKYVKRFRERLVSRQQLDSLQYIGREQQGEEMFNEHLEIAITETFIVMNSGKDTIRCKLGEMLRIDGIWKSFTDPKLGW